MNIENLLFVIRKTDVCNEALVTVVDNEKLEFSDYPITDEGCDNVFVDVKNDVHRARVHRMVDRWLDAIAAQR